MSGASERANGRGSGPGFLVDLAHSEFAICRRVCPRLKKTTQRLNLKNNEDDDISNGGDEDDDDDGDDDDDVDDGRTPKR